MSIHFHGSRSAFVYHQFMEWEHRHSRQLLIGFTAILLILVTVMAFMWISRQSRIQIYDPMQLDDLFYPYMLSVK